MEGLNDRERHIFNERRLREDPRTLEELSKVYDISRERVRQIESRAFEKVQKSVRSAVRAEARARAEQLHALRLQLDRLEARVALLSPTDPDSPDA